LSLFINNFDDSILMIAWREISASEVPDQMGREICLNPLPLQQTIKMKKVGICHSVVFEAEFGEDERLRTDISANAHRDSKFSESA
jgi:hypothetical protein